jgi:hypothetical protein
VARQVCTSLWNGSEIGLGSAICALEEI